MQLTLKGDYAVRVMLDLAGRPPSTTVRTEDLGRRTGVPPAYLSKIVQSLAQAGLVRTRRGTLGGVALLRAPESITLREVIEAVEGRLFLNRCLVTAGACALEQTCAVHAVWARIQDLVTRELEAVRLSRLAQRSPGGPVSQGGDSPS